jgi:hypothetical protein
MVAFDDEAFVVDNGYMEEVKLIMKQNRCCLAALTQSCNKQFSDSQGLDDDSSFDEEHTCVTMPTQLLKCDGIDERACRYRVRDLPLYTYNEANDPAARLRIVSRSVSGTFYGTGPCVTD